MSVPLVRSEPAGAAFDGSARARLRARGDWELLERELEWLRREAPVVWRAWWECRVEGVAGVSPLVERADGMLLGRLPGRLRCPGDVMAAFEQRVVRSDAREAARAARVYGGRRGHKRRQARALLGMGYTAEMAAKLAGCSVRTVRRAAA